VSPFSPRRKLEAEEGGSFINNEQEHARTWSSSAVDARTERELYAHPFLRMVMAGAASVMCSYNLVNGTYACENDGTLNTLLKQEIGFRGCASPSGACRDPVLTAAQTCSRTGPRRCRRCPRPTDWT
jgi:hypothetical protein